MTSPQISIIIPTLNEADNLQRLLPYLKTSAVRPNNMEILIADGGSTDNTVAIAQELGARVIHSPRGRAVQMNNGAQTAQGNLLYFLHADTFPPKGFNQLIQQNISTKQQAGSFRLRFDHKSRFLRFFAWLTRWNHPICRGGDQSLFVSRSLFWQSGGFNEAYKIYEDGEFIRRLYKLTQFTIIPLPVTTSARKYEERGLFRLQYHFSVIHVKRYMGAGPQELYSYYKNHIG